MRSSLDLNVDVRIILKLIIRNRIWGCEWNSTISEKDPMGGFCEHDNETSASIKTG
jgi:hypothetical protein